MTEQRLQARGEVSDRQELLDGRYQVALDGEAEDIVISGTLTWSLGREGDVPIEEADLTLEDDEVELNASLAGGTIEDGRMRLNPDTGAASVTVSLTVDAAEEWDGAPERVELDIEIGVDEWFGELRLLEEE